MPGAASPIGSGLRNITVRVSSYYNHTDIQDKCSYAFVVETSKFQFSNASLQELKKTTKVPVVINWAIGNKNESCDEAGKRDNYACQANTDCINVNDSSGDYRCQCKRGYQGNPYHQDGCKGTCRCAFTIFLCLYKMLLHT